MMASQNIIFWNSAGFRAGTYSTPDKFSFLDKQNPNGNFAIAALVETHHKDEGDYSQDLGQYHQTHYIKHSPVHNETHSGIIVIIRKDFEFVSQSEAIPGRLLNIKVKKLKTTINISVFYGKQWAKMKKEDIAECLGKFNDLHEPTDINLILGDFNFVDFDIDKGKKMDQRDKMIYPIWQEFLSKNGIIDPFRAQCPKKKFSLLYLHREGKAGGIDCTSVTIKWHQSKV